MNAAANNRLVAFLGSINVGGHRATSDQLCAAFEGLGHAGVETFLASGNVVFNADGEAVGGEAEAALAADAEVALAGALGFEVPVYLRAADEVRAIAREAPFDQAALEASTGKPQVILLRGAPDDDTRVAALKLSTADDILGLSPGARELYWLPAEGISDSDLDLRALATMLGPGTTRTQNTIRRIAKRFLS